MNGIEIYLKWKNKLNIQFWLVSLVVLGRDYWKKITCALSTLVSLDSYTSLIKSSLKITDLKHFIF